SIDLFISTRAAGLGRCRIYRAGPGHCFYPRNFIDGASAIAWSWLDTFSRRLCGYLRNDPAWYFRQLYPLARGVVPGVPPGNPQPGNREIVVVRRGLYYRLGGFFPFPAVAAQFLSQPDAGGSYRLFGGIALCDLAVEKCLANDH